MNTTDESNDSEANANNLRVGKAALLREIDDAWRELNAYLDSLTPEQMSEIRDAVGWAVKDHLTHLMAWERAGAAFLQGKPRNEGLGVDKQIYLSGYSGDFDPINAVVQQQWAALPVDEVRANLEAAHQELLRLIDALSDEDLLRAMGTFAPSVSGRYDDRPVSDLLYGDTVDHFREHLAWMENLVSKGGQKINRR
jgi:hypothetical protein